MGGYWMNLEVCVRKTLHCHELSRVILVKIQKTRRRAVQKASNAENKK
jgi:hypothetical protein